MVRAACQASPWWKPARRGGPAKMAGVGAAPADDDVGAGFEGFREGLDAHHGDDVGAAVDGVAGQRRDGAHRLDLALGELGLHVGLVELASENGEPEAEALVAGDAADDVGDGVDLDVAAGGARRAHDEGDIDGARPLDEGAEVLLGAPVVEGAGAELERAEVGGAGVGGDEVGLPVEACLEASVGEAGPDEADRHHAHLVHGGLRDSRLLRMRAGRDPASPPKCCLPIGVPRGTFRQRCEQAAYQQPTCHRHES